MTGNLVTFIIHAFNDGRPGSGRVIDCALSDVDSCDEESCLEVLLFEEVQNTIRVDVWTVIVGDSNGSGLLAGENALAIWHISQNRSSNVARAASRRKYVCVTSGSVFE